MPFPVVLRGGECEGKMHSLGGLSAKKVLCLSISLPLVRRDDRARVVPCSRIKTQEETRRCDLW
jgi:precorrin-2 methylase